MKYLITVVSAKYKNNYNVEIKFDDGVEGIVDCKKYLKGKVFNDYLDKNKFAQDLHVAYDTIAWGDKADIAPETLYEEVLKNKN